MSRRDESMRSYQDWPVRDAKPADIKWIGLPETSDGSAIVLHTETERIVEVEPNLEDQVLERIPGTEVDLAERDEGLAGYVEEMAEEQGWSWVSEYASQFTDDGGSA